MTIPLTRKALGPRFSEGARRLWGAVREHGSQAEVQRLLGTAPGVMSRWLYGDQRPRLAAMLLMRDLFAIPVESWCEKPKRPFLPPAARKKAA